MKKSIDCFNKMCFSDFLVGNISISEDIEIELSFEHENRFLLKCENYIGISIIGFWEDCIIDKIILSNEGDLIDSSKEKIIKNYYNHEVPFSDIKNIKDRWYQIDIILIDGCVIKIACNNVSVRKENERDFIFRLS